MSEKASAQDCKQQRLVNSSEDILKNIMRTLTMLGKALNRLARQNYFDRSQYPKIFFEIEDILKAVHSWIRDFKMFAGIRSFGILLTLIIKELCQMIVRLTDVCTPLQGKRQIGKKQRIKRQNALCKSVGIMLEHIAGYSDELKYSDTVMSAELEKWVYKAFEQHCSEFHKIRDRIPVSARGEKTYIFPWSDRQAYTEFVNDKKYFRSEVVDKLSEYPHATGHRSSCKRTGTYKMIGFRGNPRKTIAVGGQQEIFPIRMVQCKDCDEKFSLLPSFLPREKHFTIDIIGGVIQGIVLFAQSIHAVLENLKISCKGVKSRQTVLNWLRWVGTLHPATVLVRAGAKSSGYLQEDEGFEKESGMRTYTVVMTDPRSLSVWHIDYIDHVDEKTLCRSFEKFVQRINFKVAGITKDKWKPSTNALKKVFHRLWIGFCHRHCLKKFHEALSKYQKEIGCSSKEKDRLYKKFKKVLETSASQVSLEVKLRALDDDAFSHPLLQERLNELKKNAVHYTSNKIRNGISKTTSIVDNFLKTVKRKLRQVESFRDQEFARITFQCMANVRNFMPFLSGAKNAYKSPFILAQGETYGLPWIQVMNMHNSFLVTPDAF